MQTLESLKRKIAGAEDLQTVVRTMKTLAAVSIRQYEAAVDSLGDYFTTVAEGMRMLLWNRPPGMTTPATAASDNTGAIVFGSDQGMCGQFNEQIVTCADESLRTGRFEQGEHYFLAVGVRAANGLRDRGLTVDGEHGVPGSVTGIAAVVQDLLSEVEHWRSERRLGRILLFFNRRRTASTYRPHEMQLLPIADEFLHSEQRKWPGRSLPQHTMNSSELLSALVRQLLFVSLFRACAESLAGENASRIASMQSAERNIGELLAELRSNYNQRRQTSITEELLEVVTGFEVLKGEDD